jgi:hypothetical protein
MVRGVRIPPNVWAFVRQCKTLGLSIRQAVVAAKTKFGCYSGSISYGAVWSIFQSKNEAQPAAAKRTGVKKILSVRQISWLRRQIKLNQNPGEAKDAKQLADSMPGRKVSSNTIIREIRSWPDILRIKPRKALYLRPMNVKARYKGARRLCTVPAAFWSTVDYLDEKKWSASGPDSPQPIWCLKNREPQRAIHTSSRVGVMVWMGIGPDGLLGPYRIAGAINGASYTKILEEHEVHFGQRLYDDWATAHSTNKALKFLDLRGIENIRFSLCIPAKLTEVNIMEQVWAFFQRLVYKGNPAFPNANTLWNRIASIASEVKAAGQDKEWYKRLAATVPDRMKAICKSKGKQVQLPRQNK